MYPLDQQVDPLGADPSTVAVGHAYMGQGHIADGGACRLDHENRLALTGDAVEHHIGGGTGALDNKIVDFDASAVGMTAWGQTNVIEGLCLRHGGSEGGEFLPLTYGEASGGGRMIGQRSQRHGTDNHTKDGFSRLQ